MFFGLFQVSTSRCRSFSPHIRPPGWSRILPLPQDGALEASLNVFLADLQHLSLASLQARLVLALICTCSLKATGSTIVQRSSSSTQNRKCSSCAQSYTLLSPPVVTSSRKLPAGNFFNFLLNFLPGCFAFNLPASVQLCTFSFL